MWWGLFAILAAAASLAETSGGPLRLRSHVAQSPSAQQSQPPRVIFGVFTSPLPKYAKQLAALEATWGAEVPPQQLIVVGVNGSDPGTIYKPAPECEDGQANNPGISCKEATILSSGYELGADWVVVVGSDNYVFPRRFQARLAQEDEHKPQILAIWGCGDGKYCEDRKAGLCGGGGYAISRAALKRMIAGEGPEAFVKLSMETAETVGGYWSDQVTSCIARRHGVSEVSLTGLYGWKLCRSQTNFFDCGFDEDLYRQKIESTSPTALTFHYVTPEEMHRIHYIHTLADGPQLRAQANGDEGTLFLDFNRHGLSEYVRQRDGYIREWTEMATMSSPLQTLPQWMY